MVLLLSLWLLLILLLLLLVIVVVHLQLLMLSNSGRRCFVAIAVFVQFWQFHLKRFEFDPYLEDLSKINDRFEFPTELDMSPWLQQHPSSPPSPPHPSTDTNNNDVDIATSVSTASSRQPSKKYHLSAVVMHVGGPSAGHYYAYVRYTTPPSSKSPPPSEAVKEGGGTTSPRRDAVKAEAKWAKLDDQRVTEVSEAEVLRDAFGGSGGVYGGPAATGAAGFQGLLGMVRVRLLLLFLRGEVQPLYWAWS